MQPVRTSPSDPRGRPRVSVLLPARDAASHLEACLASLDAQVFEDFEIVAVDDASTDGTRELLSSFGSGEPRLRVISGRGEGLVTALNLGLRHCRGELVARMDADDLAHPDRLLRQVALFDENPELTVVSCQVEHFAAGGVGEGLRVYERWLNSLISHDDMWRERFVESPVPHPAAMFRRREITAVGGYQDRHWPEDYDLWLRLFEAGRRFGKVPAVLHRWRDRADRLTRTDPRYSVERFLECKAEYLVRGPLRTCRRLVIWGAGPTGRRISKHLLRRGAPLELFVDIDPAKWGRTVRGVPVASPDALDGFAVGEHLEVAILAAVGSRGARAKIRAALEQRAWHETRDFWCAA